MKSSKTIIILFLLLLMALPSLAQQPQGFSGSDAHVVPNFLYVRFTPKSHIKSIDLRAGRSTGHADVDRVFALLNVNHVEPFLGSAAASPTAWMFGSDRTADISYADEGYSYPQIEAMLKALPEVDMVSRRFIFKPCYQPNDPHFASGDQYGLNLMSVPTAWSTTKGSPSVVIAILDEGTNYEHEDLIANLDTNPGEMGTDKDGHDKRTNGIDDDGDGYVDNWHGWDLAGPNSNSFYPGDNDPMPGPGQGHGTFVAGCAAATPDNGIGVAGVGFHCHYLPLKCAADSGKNAGNIIYGYEAIRYASAHGVPIINCSWGGDATGITQGELDYLGSIMDSAAAHNSLVIVASGNNGKNIDDHPFIPASLTNPNVLVVGASDENDKVTNFSGFGHRVDVYAPGADIWSTEFPGNSAYGSSGGTSFSTPYTAGVAGLLLSRYPYWTYSVLKSQIIASVDPLKGTTDRNLYWGRVNAANALIASKTPSLSLLSYAVDGVQNGPLAYLNKEYTLSITFRNVLGNNGKSLSAALLRRDGYSIQQGNATLGILNPGATANGIFKFTRDTTDDGTYLPMTFYVTDGATYHDSIHLTLNINGDDIWVDTTPPSVAINGYSVDGVPSGTLGYINKQYSLSLTFQNSGGQANLSATLLRRGGYTVQSTKHSLGTVANEGMKSANFLFTRDSTDDHQTLPMDVRVESTNGYVDTLHVSLIIVGDAVYVSGVRGDASIASSDLRIAPNPATSVTTAYFNLAHDASVIISLSDLLGRTISSIHAGTFGAGANQYELPLAGLSPGVYFVRLATADGDVYINRVMIQ